MISKKKFFLITAAVILTVPGLTYLGLWQLERLKYKNHLIKQIKNNLALPPIEIQNLTSINLYSKIKLSGRFDNNEYVYLYGRRTAFPEKDGYYLLSPFITDNGNSFLVLRAWLPAAQKDQINSSSFSSSREVITVITMPGEKRQFFVPENDLSKNIWFTLDLEQAARQLGANYKNFYFIQIDNDNLPYGAKALSGNNLSNLRNDHLEYAITWFALAAALLIIYVVFLFKNPAAD